MKFLKGKSLVGFVFLGTLLSLFVLFADDYVVGELQGELGNQMFIIAATIGFSEENGLVPCFPALLTDERWNIPENFQAIFFRLNGHAPNVRIRSIYNEPYFHYCKVPPSRNVLLRGYFQSEKYFIHCKDKVLNIFAPSEEIISYLTSKYGPILENSNTVSIHCRDYRRDTEQIYHLNCTREYYINAMKHFPKESLFVVFSNNIEWCKTIFSGIEENIIFIEGENRYHDLYLMSLCKSNIIANSTYSWWAAYLNRNPNKLVVAPRKWFGEAYDMHNTEDLIPKSWIIEN